MVRSGDFRNHPDPDHPAGGLGMADTGCRRYPSQACMGGIAVQRGFQDELASGRVRRIDLTGCASAGDPHAGGADAAHSSGSPVYRTECVDLGHPLSCADLDGAVNFTESRISAGCRAICRGRHPSRQSPFEYNPAGGAMSIATAAQRRGEAAVAREAGVTHTGHPEELRCLCAPQGQCA